MGRHDGRGLWICLVDMAFVLPSGRIARVAAPLTSPLSRRPSRSISAKGYFCLQVPIRHYISRAISHADLGLNGRPVASFDRKGRGAHGSAADQPENE